MVVCLILEIDEPLLLFSIDFHRHHDAAGVDLVGYFQIIQFALHAQLLHGHQRQIHQTDELAALSL